MNFFATNRKAVLHVTRELRDHFSQVSASCHADLQLLTAISRERDHRNYYPLLNPYQ